VALVVAQAAALCAKAARLSSGQLGAERAAGLTADAERIRTAAAALIDEDPRAYAAVIEQRRRTATARTQASAGGGGRSASPGSAEDERALAAALSKASDVPMRLVELAAQVADLGTALAADGNPALRGDALAAAYLAQAAARSAATLVSINLAASPQDGRHARTASLLTAIARSVDAAGR
jgi:methenyltetrahydrofolate cyclohydrolase